MSEDINQLINPVLCNGEIVKHRVTDRKRRVIGFRSSTFIQKHNILVKGEGSYIHKPNGKLLVFFDHLTAEVKGKSNFYMLIKLTLRLWTDIEQARCLLSRPF